MTKKKCVHPFERIHWVGTTVFCNKCKTTIVKGQCLLGRRRLAMLVDKYPNDSDLGGKIRELVPHLKP